MNKPDTWEISQAPREDIPELAEINRQAYLRETTSQIAYTDWPNQDNGPFFAARLAERWQRPGTVVFKATHEATKQIDGFVCWTLEDAVDESVPRQVTPTSKVLAASSEGRNMEFVMAMANSVETLLEYMKGTKHYYLSTFAVRPIAQNKGVGTLLLQHCLAIADQDKLVSWLMAFPGSHDLYLRHGFVDIDHRDIDLNKYDRNRMRGYGIYRSYVMKRVPRTTAAISEGA